MNKNAAGSCTVEQMQCAVLCGYCSVQDFDIGATYERKVVLMNSTHSITSCKLVGMSDELKDFISLSSVQLLLFSVVILCWFWVDFAP